MVNFAISLNSGRLYILLVLLGIPLRAGKNSHS